jgi:TRAP-type C4-dicarboxylate transport system permease small subunit
MYRYLSVASQWVVKISSFLGAISALVMLTSLLAGVFFRYVLDASLSWSGEIATLAFIWTIFLFSSALIRNFGHVRVAILLDSLPHLVAETFERVILLLILIFGYILLTTGWDFTEFTANRVSAAVRYPMWLRNAAIPVCGGLIIFHSAVLLLSPTLIRNLPEVTNG